MNSSLHDVGAAGRAFVLQGMVEFHARGKMEMSMMSGASGTQESRRKRVAMWEGYSYLAWVVNCWLAYCCRLRTSAMCSAAMGLRGIHSNSRSGLWKSVRRCC